MKYILNNLQFTKMIKILYENLSEEFNDSNSPIDVSENTGSTENIVVSNAEKQIGVKYKWGGNKPETGFDCSGLVTYVTNLPRQTANGFYNNISLKKIEKTNVKPGDLVFFGNNGKAHHVGIVDSVDEQKNLKSMIHSRGGKDCPGTRTTNNGKNCVVERTTNISWYTPILGYRRL